MAIKTNLNGNALSASTREYRLPSGGVTYRDKFPTFPDTIIITPYSYRTEGVLSTNLTYFKKLAIISGMVVQNFPEGFDPANLLNADVVTILAIARGLTYGEVYKFSSLCDNCGHKEPHTVKVPDDLQVKTWSHKTMAALVKESTILLPHCKDKVAIGFLTLKDEDEIISGAAAVRKQVTDTAAALTSYGDQQIRRVAQRIVSVNTTTPDNLDEAINYVGKISGADMVALNKALVDLEPGLDFDWRIRCEKCSHEYVAEVPMAMQFFRGH